MLSGNVYYYSMRACEFAASVSNDTAIRNVTDLLNGSHLITYSISMSNQSAETIEEVIDTSSCFTTLAPFSSTTFYCSRELYDPTDRLLKSTWGLGTLMAASIAAMIPLAIKAAMKDKNKE